ncbi:tryptase-2-like [Elysia marginata]|uniref:Acrosin n=1 Tax=Elysia marginata TaxID=1093978 RepID=A0AAV4H7Z6_9GAST|nr:tryptase-2-like [Elysia marginata]
MSVETIKTDQTDLYFHACWCHDSSKDAIKALLNARPAYLLRLVVMNFLLAHCRAQLSHNLRSHYNIVPQYGDFSTVKYSRDSEYLFRNNRLTQPIEPFILSRWEKEHTPMLNKQVSPTSLISRFQYAPNPSEASKPAHRTYNNEYRPLHDYIPNHHGSEFKILQNTGTVWSPGDNLSGGLDQQEPLTTSTIQRKGSLAQLPEPRAFSELTDKILLETYRTKSPCFAAKVDWVRDSQNCSIFFVCARGRVAAIMTCPPGESWSNRVTNCVPFRSRWDDCTHASKVSQSDSGELPQPVKSTVRPRQIGRRLRRLRTTTSPALQIEDEEDHKRVQESNQGDHRYYLRHDDGSGKYYETGGRRLNLITTNRRGGYRVEKIHGAIHRQVDALNPHRFPRRKHRLHLKDRSEGKRPRRLHQREHRFKNKNIGRHKQHHHDWGHLEDQKGTSTQQPAMLNSSQAPIAASGSGTRPKIRYVITHSQRRKSRLKINGTKIKSVKDTDFDFLRNIKKINELESDGLGTYPRKVWPQDPKESNTEPSLERDPEKDIQWWLDTSNKKRLATTPKLITNSKPTTASTTPKTSTTTTTTYSTRAPNHHETAMNSSGHNFSPECGVSATSMIVGGLPAQQGRWPWVVSLQLTWNQNHVCGATLIHPQWIVTAAHCVNGPDLSKANEWRALFWQKRASKEIDVIVQHPGFVNGDNYPNDIALLRLREPADVSGFDLRHACMPKREEWKKRWEKCWIMGWGESKDDITSELKELEVKVRKNSECSARWGWKRILNSHVCAGDGGRGACNGDSGGPLICRQNGYHYLAGITSWGVGGCQTAGYPSVFTRVAFYHNWIQGVIKAFSK